MDGETEKVANSKNFDIVFRGQVEIYRNPSIDFQLKHENDTKKSAAQSSTMCEQTRQRTSEKKGIGEQSNNTTS